MPRTICEPHTHLCARCRRKFPCNGVEERNFDGWPEVICRDYHLSGQTLCDGCMEAPAQTRYVCVDCAWIGSDDTAFEHHEETGHAVRGADWPTSEPNPTFSDADDAEGRRTKGDAA